ncbi:MAG TPA: type IX secretion system membrane protein PorP/SprF [Tenuifilaceae bacterium]|nr:type IX secretion system membrane protein PorP/SprF [Tenuifilaceae bacterium]HOZ15123.1 type IX secretion system membrane protein PorP/SprF [Tenuifilaceae bacterium]HPI46264.1 type IX secretion system membrane protein PorP/SprF [Tenuifilaceae bacterium]HPV56692.1 type IX secretion system membrane protein PorP/SprF [Tenuifilaceae bacterium]
MICSKKFLLLGLVAIFVTKLNAQQEPIFTHYMQSPISINPAITGTIRNLNIDLLSRLQWVGLEGAPKSFSLSAHTPWAAKKIGVGVNIMSDNTWPISNTHISGSYAYRLRLNDEITLSMGIKGGFTYYSASLTDLHIINPDDPEFQHNERKFYPNIGVGFYMYSQKFFAGISMPRLIQTAFDRQFDKNLRRPLYLMGGYNLDITEQWVFMPSALAGAMVGVPMSVDVTAKFLYQGRFFFGTHYRIGDALGLFFDMKINKELAVGYAFDYSLNKLSKINSGTHELMISYVLTPKWKF